MPCDTWTAKLKSHICSGLKWLSRAVNLQDCATELTDRSFLTFETLILYRSLEGTVPSTTELALNEFKSGNMMTFLHYGTRNTENHTFLMPR